MRRLALAAVLTVLLGPFLATPAQAHVSATTVTVDLRADGESVGAVVDLEYDLLARVVPLGATSPADGDQAETARAAALDARAAEVAAYVAERLRVSRGSLLCESQGQGRVELVEGTAMARVALGYDCATTGALTVRSEIFRSADGIVDDATTLLTYAVDGRRGSEVLDAGHPALTVGQTAWWEQVPRFVRLGAEHLLLGLDHVLFLVALLLGARRLRDVVEVATAFTVAHSVTLVLAAIGWVSVPAWLVEPFIALSIAFVALDNLLAPRREHRLPVVFAFGLLHGLGFAGTITVEGALSWSMLVDLLSFNLGIELAQIAVIAVAFPLLLLLRRLATTPVAARALGLGTVAATLAVAGAGLAWFVERSPLLA